MQTDIILMIKHNCLFDLIAVKESSCLLRLKTKWRSFLDFGCLCYIVFLLVYFFCCMWLEYFFCGEGSAFICRVSIWFSGISDRVDVVADVWPTNCSSSLHWLTWFVGCCSWLSSKCQKCLLLLLLVVCFGYLDNLTTC